MTTKAQRIENPGDIIPRDKSGSYLHLKLKRFSSIDDLTMPYAKTTWKKTPHDAEVDVATTDRSSCRQCHSKINKGQLRFRLWLQCHKGCKNSAYFHSSVGCFWMYPETIKLQTLDEIVGLDKLSNEDQVKVTHAFEEFRNNNNDKDNEHEKKKKKKKRKLNDTNNK